jgi:hypothetical protein
MLRGREVYETNQRETSVAIATPSELVVMVYDRMFEQLRLVLAGLQAGLCAPPEEFQSSWALERRFTPAIDPAIRDAKYARWGRAVAATMSV